ncbi:hypothetical protein GCM10023094_31840 [Rhodococcus olei]|uniref:Signal transduction histidine kinase n=1 Tax=Rhodococcus olei TaxID=2161675 RepID=A0ABP8P823_9NOCA
MDRPIAKVVVLAFCVTSALRAVTYLGDAQHVWPILAALALCTAGAFAIVAVPGDPMPAPTATALTLLGPVTCLLVLPQIPTRDWIMSDIWHLRAVAVILCFLSLRGRMVHACVGAALSMAAFTAWTTVTDQGWNSGLRLSTIIFAPVLISVLVAVTVRPMAFVVFTLQDRESERAADEAMTLAVTAERERHLAALDASARPLLEAAAGGRVFTADDREHCAVLEERLRDTLRAPVFADDEDLARATAAARRRGTRVILLDDGGLTDTALVVRVRVALVDELDATAGGTLTARALPAGRAVAATIVIEEGTRVRRVEFDRVGGVRVEVRNGDEPDRDYQAVRSITGA